MPPEERLVFEQRLAHEAPLRQRCEELKLLAEGISAFAQRDIRQTVLQVSEKIRAEENGAGKNRFSRQARLLWFAIGLLAGICIGWLVWGNAGATEAKKMPERQAPQIGTQPVTGPQYETLATLRIPSVEDGKNIPLTILHDPSSTGRLRYALDPGGVGLCLFTIPEDPVWRSEIALHQEGSQFFLQIGSQRFEVLDDGNEHLLDPEK
jgi:hypothetical protein